MYKINIPDKEELVLRGRNIDDVIKSALGRIDEERKGIQKGLFCRWQPINILQGKYWRFRNVHLIAAPSGHGKSLITNILMEDFTSLKPYRNRHGEIVKRGLNENFIKKLIVLYFGLEQDPEDEIIRNASRLTKYSFQKLTSAEYSDVKNEFLSLTDDEYNYVEGQLNHLKGRPIFYFHTKATVNNIYHTAIKFKKLNPDAEILVTIDHNFLITKLDYSQSDLGLVQDIAHLYLSLKKEGFMVIGLHQMNNKIQEMDRLIRPEMHYPKDSDIYMVNEIKWACDNIFIFPYKPAIFSIQKYGVERILTTQIDKETNQANDLIVCSKVKSRNGFVADVYFVEKYSQGRLIYKPFDELQRDKK